MSPSSSGPRRTRSIRASIAQLKNVAALPWVAHHVAVMPDVHVGRGATVGSVIAMRGAVAPAAVGVDIGCGMAAVETSLRARDLPAISAASGARSRRRSPWAGTRTTSRSGRGRPTKRDGTGAELMARFSELEANVRGLAGRASCQIGTLGGGNHFIEICLDTTAASG